MSGVEPRTSTNACEEQPGSELRDSADQSNGTVTRHYHGSCSECHHFHRRVAFEVPVDDEPMRFNCERCKHPIFGLGRTDTQITLASQDSFPLVDGAVDQSSLMRCCDNQPTSQPILRVVTSMDQSTRPPFFGQLSAIEEQNSPAAASATVTTIQDQQSSLSRRDALGLREQQVPFADMARSKISSPDRCTGINGHHAKRKSRMLSYVSKILGQIAKRVCGESRQFRLFGFGLSFQLTSDYVPHPETSNRSSVRSAEAQQPSTEISDPRPVPHSSLSNGPRQGHEVDQIIPGRTHIRDLSTKDQRLRNHRRDQTLRKQALQKRCTCTQGCQCKLKRSDSSSVAASGPSNSINGRRRGSDLSIDLTNGQIYDDVARSPSPDFEGLGPSIDLRNIQFNHLGGVFYGRRGSSRDNSSSSGNTSWRRRQDLSAGSNASSVSLHPSRPILPQRSLSTSVLSSSLIPGHYDSIVSDVFQNLHIIHRTRSSATRPSALSWLHNGDVNPNPDSDSSEQVDGDPTSRAHTSLTLGNHISNSQQDQLNVDDERTPEPSQSHSLAEELNQVSSESHDVVQTDGSSPQTGPEAHAERSEATMAGNLANPSRSV